MVDSIKRFRGANVYAIIFGAASASMLYQAWQVSTAFVRWPLFWSSLSFALVSLAYFKNTSSLFGKNSQGIRRIWATITLAPFLTFVRITWRLQVAVVRETAWHAVGPNLIVARRLYPNELPPVDVVCDLTAEFVDPKEIREHPGYICFPILDATAPDPDELLRLLQRFSTDDRLLIHCANGHGRSGLIAGAWLLYTQQFSNPQSAVESLKSVRPGIRLNHRQWRCLAEVQKRCQQEISN